MTNPNIMRSREIMADAHDLLKAGVSVFGTGTLRTMIHETFWLHWYKLMKFHEAYLVHLPDAQEEMVDRYFTRIEDQILKQTFTAPTTEPLETPDVAAVNLFLATIGWAVVDDWQTKIKG